MPSATGCSAIFSPAVSLLIQSISALKTFRRPPHRCRRHGFAGGIFKAFHNAVPACCLIGAQRQRFKIQEAISGIPGRPSGCVRNSFSSFFSAPGLPFRFPALHFPRAVSLFTVRPRIRQDTVFSSILSQNVHNFQNIADNSMTRA